jgi:hypothetical protein
MSYDKKAYIKNKINASYKNKFKQKQVSQKLKNNMISEWKLGGFNKIYSNIKTRIRKVFNKY